MNDILTASNLYKSFGQGAGKVEVLRGLDINVARGEFLAVMGPSGCGKSTLLHVLGLMTNHDEGSITFNGSDIPLAASARAEIRRKSIGFVFQRFNLISVLSAEDNVEISLKVRGATPKTPVNDLFEAMGIADVAARKPSQMSIGQQQRVAIIRALAHSPEILFADEPTGNLDSESSAALLQLLGIINRETGQTIVMITHSANAAAHADRIITMSDGKC
ncbi:MAG TPA: ABC transporter ATP-binding protein [Phycisphaerae bacterium]|nr:ABC transporter ATP-binding protein [Phycisphaerae bacterium]